MHYSDTHFKQLRPFAGIHHRSGERSPANIAIYRFENQNYSSRVLNPPGLLLPKFLIRILVVSTPADFMCHYLLSLL